MLRAGCCCLSEHRPVPAPGSLCSAALQEATGWAQIRLCCCSCVPSVPPVWGQLLESQMLSLGSLLVVMGTVLLKEKGVISLRRCLENH